MSRTIMYPRNRCIDCNIERTLDVIGGKWSFLVLRELFGGTRRFGELQRLIPAVSPRALTSTVATWNSRVYWSGMYSPRSLVTVEYTLTPKGEICIKCLKK